MITYFRDKTNLIKSELVRNWYLIMDFNEYQSHCHWEQIVAQKNNLQKENNQPNVKSPTL